MQKHTLSLCLDHALFPPPINQNKTQSPEELPKSGHGLGDSCLDSSSASKFVPYAKILCVCFPVSKME